MIIIVCVDDNFGMMFNNRRQSQDNILRKRILQYIDNKRLLMNSYSASQFNIFENEKLIIADNFMDIAKENDYCFVENIDIIQYVDKIEKIIMYHWNRTYPADMYFKLILNQSIWKLETSVNFVGSSHEKITEEVYKNEK